MSVRSPLRAAALLLGLAVPVTISVIPPLLAETTVPLAATAVARLAALGAIFRIDPMLAVVKDEGIAYGADLDADMLEGQGGPVWLGKVGAVYDLGRMRQIYDRAMLAELGTDPVALAGIEAFFATGLGRKVMALELEARRTLLDKAAETAAQRVFAGVKQSGGARLTALTDFARINDLVESNVTGALNANLAFYRGLGAEGVFDGEMTEDQMLAEVWAAEADVRAETEDWLFPFLNLAYQPLSAAELQDYLAFCRTAAGQRLNRAMFVAFDEIFTTISFDLGRALGREMQGQVL